MEKLARHEENNLVTDYPSPHTLFLVVKPQSVGTYICRWSRHLPIH